MAAKRASAGFVEPMRLLRTEKLPEGPNWLYELKFDGYPATNRDLCAVGEHNAGGLGIDMHAVNLYSDILWRKNSYQINPNVTGRVCVGTSWSGA